MTFIFVVLGGFLTSLFASACVVWILSCVCLCFWRVPPASPKTFCRKLSVCNVLFVMVLSAIAYTNSCGRKRYGRRASQYQVLEKEMPSVVCEPGCLWEWCSLSVVKRRWWFFKSLWHTSYQNWQQNWVICDNGEHKTCDFYQVCDRVQWEEQTCLLDVNGVYLYRISILFLVRTDFLLVAKNPFGRELTTVAGKIKLQHYGINPLRSLTVLEHNGSEVV